MKDGSTMLTLCFFFDTPVSLPDSGLWALCHLMNSIPQLLRSDHRNQNRFIVLIVFLLSYRLPLLQRTAFSEKALKIVSACYREKGSLVCCVLSAKMFYLFSMTTPRLVDSYRFFCWFDPEFKPFANPCRLSQSCPLHLPITQQGANLLYSPSLDWVSSVLYYGFHCQKKKSQPRFNRGLR